MRKILGAIAAALAITAALATTAAAAATTTTTPERASATTRIARVATLASEPMEYRNNA